MSVSDSSPAASPPLPPTALVVEAHEDARRRVCAALQAHGLITLEASDGLTGWQMLTVHGDRIRLLVTNLALPGLGGGVLAELARELWPRLSILMLSDQPAARVVERFPSLARVSILRVPFRHEDLIAALRTLLLPEV